MNTLPQATNGQVSTTPQRGRGGRGGYRGRGGRGRGGLILCYWCRDFLPKEQANHKVAQFPYQKQAKDNWGKNQLGTVQGNTQMTQPNIEGKLVRGTTVKSTGEVPVDSPNDSKPLREIKQMLNFEKNSSKANSENISSHTFNPTSNVRNGFRRKKGDSSFTYNLNLKVKKEKKQSNFTNPDPWARIVGSRNTAAIYMNGMATTALFDTGAEIQLVSKQFCEDNE